MRLCLATTFLSGGSSRCSKMADYACMLLLTLGFHIDAGHSAEGRPVGSVTPAA